MNEPTIGTAYAIAVHRRRIAASKLTTAEGKLFFAKQSLKNARREYRAAALAVDTINRQNEQTRLG